MQWLVQKCFFDGCNDYKMAFTIDLDGFAVFAA